MTQETNMTDAIMRRADLRQLLIERRREMQDGVQNCIRHGRTDRPHEVRDDLEVSDADLQRSIELALLQMRAETVIHIDQALVQLDAGQFGSCVECESEISGRRLRALPFSRCKARRAKREAKRSKDTRGWSLNDAAGSSDSPMWSVPDGDADEPQSRHLDRPQEGGHRVRFSGLRQR
jgi:RNA polymerase-binding transcription factor DksA